LNLGEWIDLWVGEFGFNVFPLKHQSKNPAVPSWKEYQTKPFDGKFLEGQNLAVICGKISGVIVIDIDDKTLINEILVDSHGSPTYDKWKGRTLIVETDRGIHIYVRPKDGKYPPTAKLTDAQGRGIDIKGEGGYVVAPPSIHPNGSKYQVVSYKRTIAEIDVTGFIEDLKTHGGFSGGLKKGKLADVMEGSISEGGRNDSAYIMARFLLNPTEGANDKDEAKRKLKEWNKTNLPPLEDSEIDTIFESAQNIPFEERPAEFNKNSFKRNYVARHITVTLHPKTLRENEEIYVYKNGLYIEGGETHIREMLHRLYYGVPRNEVNEVLATVRATTYVTNRDFDTHAEIIHCKNCLVNVKNMKVFDQTHTLLTRNQLNTVYNPNAKCPQILKFLSEVMPDPSDLKTLIELMSSILLYKLKLEKAIVFVGDQANGKSTLIELLVDLLGEDNISNVSLQRLAVSQFSTSNMIGKILNAYGDLDVDSIEQTGMIKQIISHDHIMVEKKNKNAFSTRIPIRLLYSANRLPELPNADEAIFRRFWVIKWTIVIPPEKRDLKLLEKLTSPEEKSGFLNILLKNAHQLLHNNFQFTHPQHLEETKQRWREKSDSVSSWVEYEIAVNPDYKINSQDLYGYYKNWCIEAKLMPTSDRAFFTKLEGLGPFRKFRGKEKGKSINMVVGAKPRKIIAEEKRKEGQAQL
jgi:putative DNA primase/helicase